MGYYDIVREFTAGYATSVGLLGFREPDKSLHWLAGWDAGYEARKQKNEAIDKYLVSIGQFPQAVLKIDWH